MEMDFYLIFCDGGNYIVEYVLEIRGCKNFYNFFGIYFRIDSFFNY